MVSINLTWGYLGFIVQCPSAPTEPHLQQRTAVGKFQFHLRCAWPLTILLKDPREWMILDNAELRL